MGTKITTLKTAFIKYLVMLVGGLGLSVVIPFIMLWLCVNFGVINYANRNEQIVKAVAPVLASMPDLTTMTETIPDGCDYLLLDKSYNILETTLTDSELKPALEYATKGTLTPDNGKQFTLVTRDNELIVLQYYIGSRFINPWLNRHLPSPEILLLFFIILNGLLVCVFLTLHFSGRLRKQLLPLFHATEEISSQNLDFEIGQSNIKEFEDVLLSFSKMRDNLKKSLEQQWAAEQTRKEQIAALAHDLKTPLTVIRGNIDLLEETPLNSEQQEFIKYASFSSEQMESYIKTLIELSRSSMGYGLLIQQIPFSSFWDNLCEQIRALCSIRHINLQTDIDTPPEYFQGDKILIERAVMNIVSNALEFSPEQSILKVKTGGDGKTLKIRITDSGTGFSQKALKHAKELFFMDDQSRSSKLHFGMGLYITNHIVEQHHGNMQIQNSAETKGGKVILTFPLNQEQQATPL